MSMFRPSPKSLRVHDLGVAFHVMLGLDPFGAFTELTGLSYKLDTHVYKELGRNHSPVQLPFDNPGQPGEITLKWGYVVRSKLFRWMESVEVGSDFRKDVFLFHSNRVGIPLRIYLLAGCWPVEWEADGFQAESGQKATETLKLAYDQILMVNTSAAVIGMALADQLSGIDIDLGLDMGNTETVYFGEWPKEKIDFTAPDTSHELEESEEVAFFGEFGVIGESEEVAFFGEFGGFGDAEEIEWYGEAGEVGTAAAVGAWEAEAEGEAEYEAEVGTWGGSAEWSSSYEAVVGSWGVLGEWTSSYESVSGAWATDEEEGDE